MNRVISMSNKETERITVMDNLIAKRIKQKHAGKQLGISIRQVQRMVKRYKREGVAGLVHTSRGRTGNRRMPLATQARIANLIKTAYSDFGPTLACEKLSERDGIKCSSETVRKIMIAEGLWKA